MPSIFTEGILCSHLISIYLLTGFKDMKIVEIEDMAEMDAIQDYCKELTNARSVPRVWINKKFIGGGDEVEQAFKKGELQKMV